MQDVTIKEMIEEFLYDMEVVSKRSEATIKQYEMALNEFDKYLFDSKGKISDMKKLRARDIVKGWFNVRQSELSASSLNQRLVALSMFYQFLIGELFDVKEVTRGIPKFSEDEEHLNNDKKKFLGIDEARNIVKVVESKDKKLTKYENLRNEMIIKLFLGCGLRISELSKLEYKHINIDERRIYITSDIAKFKKARTVDIPDDVINLYARYLMIRKNHKNTTDFLFISRKNNPIHPNTIRDLVTKISIKANGEKINPHGLRHTYGTQQIAAGQDPLYVSQQMGHSNLEITTAIYIHQDNNSINKANNNPIFNK